MWSSVDSVEDVRCSAKSNIAVGQNHYTNGGNVLCAMCLYGGEFFFLSGYDLHCLLGQLLQSLL